MFPADFLFVILGKGFFTALAALTDFFVTEGFWRFVIFLLALRFFYFLGFRK